MPREGTRSATGNARPRVFQTVDTAPAIKRTTKPKAAKPPVAEPTVKPVKPTGVTKKKALPKKDGVSAKVQTAVKNVEAKAKKVASKAKTDAKPKADATKPKIDAAKPKAEPKPKADPKPKVDTKPKVEPAKPKEVEAK